MRSLGQELVVPIFWLIVFGIFVLIRRRNINKGIHAVWQDQEVLSRFGQPNEKYLQKYRYINENFVKRTELLRYIAVTQKTYSDDELWMEGTCIFLHNRDFGVGDIILAINIDCYHEKITDRRALRFRDIVLDAWTNRPTDWDYMDVLQMPLTDEQIKKLESVTSAFVCSLLSLPPEIKAKLGGKERQEFLKELNIN